MEKRNIYTLKVANVSNCSNLYTQLNIDNNGIAKLVHTRLKDRCIA